MPVATPWDIGGPQPVVRGLENRFDTVVDCAVYHSFALFSVDRELQTSYVLVLHRATKSGALRLTIGPGRQTDAL